MSKQEEFFRKLGTSLSLEQCPHDKLFVHRHEHTRRPARLSERELPRIERCDVGRIGAEDVCETLRDTGFRVDCVGLYPGITPLNSLSTFARKWQPIWEVLRRHFPQTVLYNRHQYTDNFARQWWRLCRMVRQDQLHRVTEKRIPVHLPRQTAHGAKQSTELDAYILSSPICAVGMLSIESESVRFCKRAAILGLLNHYWTLASTLIILPLSNWSTRSQWQVKEET